MLQTITIRDALNSALDEEMSRDPDVFILGEEVSIDVFRLSVLTPLLKLRFSTLFIAVHFSKDGIVMCRLVNTREHTRYAKCCFAYTLVSLSVISAAQPDGILVCRSHEASCRSMARIVSETHPSQR